MNPPPPSGSSPGIPAAPPPPPPPAPHVALVDRRRDPGERPGWRSGDIVRATALVALVYLGLQLVWYAHDLVITIFLGVLFGLAISVPVDWLQRRARVPRGVGATLVLVSAIGILVGFGAWAAPVLRTQSQELKTRLPEAMDKLQAWAEAHRTGVLGLVLPEEGPAGAPKPGSTPLAPAGASPGATGGSAPSPPAVAQDTTPGTNARQSQPAGGSLREQLTAQVSGAKHFFFGFVSSAFSAVIGLLFVIFTALYVAADPGLYRGGVLQLLPARARPRTAEVLGGVAATLRKWLRAQAIAMLVIGTVTTVAYLLLGVRAAVPLGILAGILEFIPTVGPVLSVVPALLMGFVDSPQKALTVVAVYAAIQFLESHILIPNLMREIDLPPVMTLAGQALMALLFGFLGLFVAVPLLAAIVVVVRMWYVEDVVGEVAAPVTGPPPPAAAG